MIDILNSKGTVKIVSTNKKTRIFYLFDCLDCKKEIKVRSDATKRSTGKCQSCVSKKKPFYSIYLGLFRDHRKINVELTYEEFLDFTKIKNCYYCNGNVPWSKYGTEEGEYSSRAYFLDRMQNNEGYTKDNCVVCCTRCNKFKKDMDHNEFIIQCGVIHETWKNRLIETYKLTLKK